jgi:hypothetical protein
MTTSSRDPWLTDHPWSGSPRKSATSHSGQQAAISPGLQELTGRLAPLQAAQAERVGVGTVSARAWSSLGG